MILIENTFATMYNDRININNDRAEGYEQTSKETDGVDLKSLSPEMASRSQRVRNELVVQPDGKSTESRPKSGKIFRMWMDLKAALTGKGSRTKINLWETGQEAAIKTYKEALESDDQLSGNIRERAEKQFIKLRPDAGRIKMLRNSH